ncbi:uncharacterized protein LOC121039607 isoform X4 [Herpailurus yagouaroundi]|uniref:uncharacterized protein LOC121039607 isoform X4 n=1 Tax=Herpailurus yagouaroundi TaxID=1608482 RepID=UPI001AD65B7F|nr:uncharacterized protein LOC121039607 isoform X4 [Puma yagouaroundi]
MAPKRAKSSSGPLGPLQKEILQVSASSGEMRVRPQNCTGTNSSLNLVLIPTWVLTERPEECNPAHPVAARWSARNRRNVEEGQPPSSSPSTCLVLGTDRDVHRDPVAPSAYRQVRTATWVTSCDPRASGRWEAFGTLSSVTMRLLQVVLAAVFIIFQVLPAATRAFNFERPCYLRGGICLKQGTPDCEPFRGPCRAFTVCCKVKGLWGRAAAEKP